MKKSASLYLAFDLGASSGRAVLGLLQDRRLKIKEISRFANAPCQTRMGGGLGISPALWNNIRSRDAVVCQARPSAAVGRWRRYLGRRFRLAGRRRTPAGQSHVLPRPVSRVASSARSIGPISQEELYRLTGMPLQSDIDVFAIGGAQPQPRGRHAEIRQDSADDAGSVSLFSLRPSRRSSGPPPAPRNSSTSATPAGARRLFKALHLPRRILPELVKPATVVGRMSHKLAAEAGLNRVPVIAVAGHDTASAVAAAPLADEDAAFISCGTWLVVGTVEDGRSPRSRPCGGVLSTSWAWSRSSLLRA